MKLLVSFSLLIGLSFATTGISKAPPSKNSLSSLQKTTDELFMISRLTNGIAIQNEINSNTLRVDQFVAEVLGADSETNGLADLLKIDETGVAEKYNKLAKDASAINKTSLNSTEIERNLNTLGDMGSNLDVLKKVKDVSLKEIVENAKLSMDTNRVYFAFNSFKTFSESLKTALDSNPAVFKELQILPNSFSTMKTYFEEVRTFFKNIKNFETNLEDLWKTTNMTEEIQFLQAVERSSKQFKNNFKDLSSLNNNIEDLKKEFSVAENGLKNIFETKTIAGKLNAMREVLEEMASNPLQNRLLTAGFPKGSTDMKLMFKEIKGEWMLEVVANNDETGWNTLIEELNDFKTLSEKTDPIILSWENLKKIDLKHLNETTTVWNRIAQTSLNSSKNQEVRQSASHIADCLREIKPISDAFNVDALGTAVRKLEDLSRFATNTHKLFSQLATIEVMFNNPLLDSFGTVINDVNLTYTQNIIDALSLFKSNKEYQKLIQGIEKGTELVKKIDDENYSKVLNSKDVLWDTITNVQPELENSKLISSLECLKEKKFDNDGISEVLNFGSSLRALGVHHQNDKTSVPFIQQMGVLKSSYEAIVKKDVVKNRSKRSASYFSALDNPLTVSVDLGKGVLLLQKLVEVQKNEKTMIEVSRSGKEVFNELKNILPSIDPSSFQKNLEKMTKDVENLESTSQKNSDEGLQKYVSLFELASGIQGVSINSSSLIDPISTSFNSSLNPEIKKSSSSFRVLGSLQLDYSTHQTEFKTASLSVLKLKQFLDPLFPKKESQWDFKSLLPYGYAAAGTLAVAGIISVVVYFVSKRITYRRKQDDPNSFLYMALQNPEERRRYGKSYWIEGRYVNALFQNLVSEKSIDEFKRLVDEGINVNAYCANGKSYTTILHLSVCLNYPERAEYLIRNGAFVDAKNEKYLTPSDYTSEVPLVASVLENLKGMTFRRRVPPEFKPKEFQVFTKQYGRTEHVYPLFYKKFKTQVTTDIDYATHIVLFNETENVMDLDCPLKRGLFHLIFTGRMVMTEKWIDYNGKSRSKTLKIDYSKDRVTGVRFDGREYNTILDIYTHAQERRIPFLTKIKAYFHGEMSDYWLPCASAVSYLGGVPMSHGLLPRVNDDVFRQLNPAEHLPRVGGISANFFYYFKNQGPIFIFTNNPEQIKQERTYLDNNNWITWMNEKKFMHLVFNFNLETWPFQNEIVGEDVPRTEMPENYQYPDPNMALIQETEWII